MKAALGDQQPLALICEVSEQFASLLIEYRGADRNRKRQIVTAGAGAVSPPATFSAGRPIVFLEPVVNHGIERRVRDQPHAAAVAAVATVGPATRYILFAAKAQATVTALAGGNADCRFIYKFHGLILYWAWQSENGTG